MAASIDIDPKLLDAMVDGDHAFLNRLRSQALQGALRAFREAGIEFQVPETCEAFDWAMAAGLASASLEELEALGARAPEGLTLAVDILHTLADQHLTLELLAAGDIKPTADAWAHLLLTGVEMGRLTSLAAITRLGWVDQLLELEEDRALRRKGAELTNRRHAESKRLGLSEAQQILATNPTLSHEQLALKLHERILQHLSVRTIARWVSTWRRDGALAAQRVVDR